jgi:hypothetical protein
MWIDWDVAAVISALLALGVLGTRRSSRPWVRGVRTFSRELSLVLLLYAIWQLAHVWTRTNVVGATDNARTIIDIQNWMHLPGEASLQDVFLPHSLWVQAMNVYYATVHVPALGAFLIWLFYRHRDRYPPVRNTLALLTGACLMIQMIPVAPPRMLPGFVDTGLLYEQSVYGRGGSGIANQLSAMPSVHVAWAAVVTGGVIWIGRSRWRWLVLLHMVLTMLAITVTANHWWLDGIVAVVLLGMAAAVVAAVTTVVRRLQRPAGREPLAVPAIADSRELELTPSS